MGRRDDYRTELHAIDRSGWAAFLTAHSGLPGPRGNIELAQAAADEGSAEAFDRLIATDDEYLVFCGVVGLGRLAAEGDGAGPPVERRLRAHAADGRWRVREAVAMALQRLGDADPPRLHAVVGAWLGDPDPLVQRAAVAGICEPRLLSDPASATCALDACERATGWVASLPAEARKDPGVRTLRQALGYCWSVAVAAAPAAGLPRFGRLSESQDPDVAWIVRENTRKARLSRLL